MCSLTYVFSLVIFLGVEIFSSAHPNFLLCTSFSLQATNRVKLDGHLVKKTHQKIKSDSSLDTVFDDAQRRVIIELFILFLL